MRNKNLFIAAALAGITLGGMAGCADTPKAIPTGECQGVNSCKGKGDCSGKGHGCAAQNSCKGKGWKKTTEESCMQQKGSFSASKS